MRAAAKAAVTPPRPFSYTLSYIQHDSWCFLSSGVVDYDRRGKEGDLYAVLTPQTEPHRYHLFTAPDYVNYIGITLRHGVETSKYGIPPVAQ